jgi:Mn2+/Fe2+ NRAMP family transporter
MADGVHLLLPGPHHLFVLFFGLLSLVTILFVPYSSYVRYLKWLTLSLFAYVAVIFFVRVDWHEVLKGGFVPHLKFQKDYLTAIAAVLGTTISPYLFFWQSSQEVEEVKKNRGEKALKRDPRQARVQLERIRLDTFIGMALSNAVAFSIILTAASTLHAHGVTDVATSAQAASALKPLAGRFAAALFAGGIVGTGLLAIPVLSASAAYGIGEACRWNVSLEKPPRRAAQFYAVIGAATLVGLSLNFAHIDPVKALFWSAVLNGLVAGPLMAVIMMIASSRKVMGKFALTPYLRIYGWLATLVMCGVGLGVLVSWK